MEQLATNIIFKKTIFLILLAIFIFSKSNSQIYSRDTSINLYKFFQKNFDTTFILFSEIPRTKVPDFFIIAKKEKKILLFSYENLYNVVLSDYPVEVKKFFITKKIEYLLTKPDTNKYLRPIPLDTMNRKIFWSKLSNLNAYNLKNDNNDDLPCKDNFGKEHFIYDDYSVCLGSIVRNRINIVSFYAPIFFEKMCTSNVNRKKIILINELFYEVFKKIRN